MKQLGKYGIQRNYFEHDTKFSEAAQKLLDAYEQSCRFAMLTSRHAISNNALASVRQAQWHEAVTLTIEFCLVRISKDHENSEDAELPDAPDFKNKLC